jgi:hypothetical protein
VRARALLIVTAIVSSLLGAVVVYLVLTVPNDVAAAQLMKQAKADIDAGRNDKARESLSKIVQQYPRTDAAAAATVALVKLADADRAKLAVQLAALQHDIAGQKQQLGDVSTKVGQLAAAPPPAPEPKPAPKPAAKKKKRTRSHHRRRR